MPWSLFRGFLFGWRSCIIVRMNNIGIVQGRLTPRNGRSIQFFPFDNWRNEFGMAASLGLAEIEFIFDYDRFEDNPLWTRDGRAEIRSLIAGEGVAVRTICADYFMAVPFFRTDKSTQDKNIVVFQKIVDAAFEIGAVRVEIPLLDNSSMKTLEEETVMIDFLRNMSSVVRSAGIFINLESDLGPEKYADFLVRLGDASIGVTYDSGNSSGLGYEVRSELSVYGGRVSNVHIKDRVLGGSTVPLGTGSARFDDVFGSLKETGYKGSIILQACRGEDGKEMETVAAQKDFVTNYLNKYGF